MRGVGGWILQKVDIRFLLHGGAGGSFAYVRCNPGYECVSHVRAFGMGHVPSVAEERTNLWKTKMHARLNPPIAEAKEGEEGVAQANAGADNAATGAQARLFKGEILRGLPPNDMQNMYEEGCPISGFYLGFAAKRADKNPFCYNNTGNFFSNVIQHSSLG